MIFVLAKSTPTRTTEHPMSEPGNSGYPMEATTTGTEKKEKHEAAHKGLNPPLRLFFPPRPAVICLGPFTWITSPVPSKPAAVSGFSVVSVVPAWITDDATALRIFDL